MTFDNIIIGIVKFSTVIPRAAKTLCQYQSDLHVLRNKVFDEIYLDNSCQIV